MEIKLEDKYKLSKGTRFLTGAQALVRVPIVQSRRDKQQNINTACYISGYRGSPLGGYDQQIIKNKKYLNENNIFFQPGINEELAATSLWGTQQVNLRKKDKYDGVFGIWYGKGPGVDRAGDALKHVNLAGTSKFGGVIALMGDDHICESSTTSHQSEFGMIDAMIPFLNPSGVQEILDYGIIGIELSRKSGCWVGIKCVHDNVSSGATVDLNENRVVLKDISDENYPSDGLNIRLKDTAQEKEYRLHHHKLKYVKEYCKLNNLNKLICNADPPAVYEKMLNGNTSNSFLFKWKKSRMEYSMGLFVYYFGTKKKYENVEHHTIKFGNKYKDHLDDIFNNKKLNDDISYYLHRPSATDKTMAPEGNDCFYVLVPVPNNQSKIDWSVEGEKMKNLVIDKMQKDLMPNLKDNIVEDFYLTPDYFEKELNTKYGSGFSIQPKFSQSAYFRFHNKSEIYKGLYFVGAGTHPGAGVPGVLSSAKVLEKIL